MRNYALATVVFSLATALCLSTAVADDWTVVRMRGGVFALDNGAWVQLQRGSVVSDDRVIKSAPGGRITLVRDAETIEIGPDTTAQIADSSGFTTVYNHEGTVGIDAEARNVQHFSVQTPFLAAVVKGTAFTVQTSPKTSTVTVARGTVQVDDEQFDSSVSVVAGEQVSTGSNPITQDSIVQAPPDAPKPPAPAAQQPPTSATDLPVATPNRVDGSASANTTGSNPFNVSASSTSNAGGNDVGNNGQGNIGKDGSGLGGSAHNSTGSGDTQSGGDNSGNGNGHSPGGNDNSNKDDSSSDGKDGGNGNSGNGNSGGNGHGSSNDEGHGKPDKPEGPGSSDSQDKPEKPDKPDKPDKPEGSGNSDKPDKPDKHD